MMDLMLHPVPAARVTATQAWERWTDVRRNIWPISRSWRLRPRSEPLVATAVLDTVSLLRLGYNATRWVVGW